MATRVPLVAFVLALALAAFGAPSCGTQCDRNPNEPPVGYDGGLRDVARGTYFSSDSSGPYLDFPPGRTYRFYHRLGGCPESLHATISFAEFPTQGTDPEGFVQAAGNQVTFEAVTADYVDVRNDTCSDVRIRVELRDPVIDASCPGAVVTDAGGGGSSTDAPPPPPVTARDAGDGGA